MAINVYGVLLVATHLRFYAGYRPFSKKEFDQAGDNVATASYPFLAEAIADPYAPLEVLLSKKPRSLHAKSAPSQSKSKPSSSKATNPDS
ncbi:hypothetical protein Tco_0260910 [Tanacetum coccineum]